WHQAALYRAQYRSARHLVSRICLGGARHSRQRTARESDPESPGGCVSGLERLHGGATDCCPTDRVGHAGRISDLRLPRERKNSGALLASSAAPSSTTD